MPREVREGYDKILKPEESFTMACSIDVIDGNVMQLRMLKTIISENYEIKVELENSSILKPRNETDKKEINIVSRLYDKIDSNMVGNIYNVEIIPDCNLLDSNSLYAKYKLCKGEMNVGALVSGYGLGNVAFLIPILGPVLAAASVKEGYERSKNYYFENIEED